MSAAASNGAGRHGGETAPRIVVIGGGIAAQATCEAVRERSAIAGLTLVSAEETLPYDRVRLSEILVSEDDPYGLALRPEEWYADRDVAALLGARVTTVDLDARCLDLESGERLEFDQVVFATGSDPLLLPLPGVGLPGVHVFRTPSDCAAIRLQACQAERAAVIGGGLLGLEAARGVAAQGCPVTVVHVMDRLMERQLDEGAARMLLDAIRELGVEVLMEHETVAILGDETVDGLRFAGGEELRCDLVVMSVGISPQIELAREAGLTCGRGIVVDDRLRTSHPAAVAVGECAEHRGVVYGLVAPIYDQAKVAADSLLGIDGPPYGGSVPSAKLKVMGVDLVASGAHSGDGGITLSDGATGVYRKLVVQDRRATGAILLGDVRGSEVLLEAVRSDAEVQDPLATLTEASRASAADLPDQAQICNCHGVCKAQIAAAVREQGLRSAREVSACTKAGTGCGSCKPAVAEIVVAETGSDRHEPAYLCPCLKQTRDELVARVRESGLDSVSELSAALGTGRACGACKPGLAYLVSEVNGNRHREERHARFINDRVHANIQGDGTFSVVPRIRGGVTTPDELRRIADVAERHEVPMVKITGGQRLDLLGVRKEQLPAIWEELGMPSGHAYAKAVRTVKTCVGTDFCRFGLGDAIAVGIELERRMEGLYTPHKVKSSVSGCPRNCAESYVKDIGIVAIEGAWEIYVGGAAGSTVRKGDLLTTVGGSAEALEIAITFLQFYRENAEYLERTYAFCERLGIDAIREVVLHPDAGAELRERFQSAKAAANVDPWLERRDPMHPKQFAELDSDPEPVSIGAAAGDALRSRGVAR